MMVLRSRFIEMRGCPVIYGAKLPETVEETVSLALFRGLSVPLICSLTAPQGFVLSVGDPAGTRMHGLFRWSGKWWPGMIPLAILWAIAAWSSTVPFETDLAQRTAALAKPSSTRPAISVAGRDLTLSADAFSEDGRRSSIAMAEAVPGVRLVRDQTRIIDEAKPFVWSAERNVFAPDAFGQVAAAGGQGAADRGRARHPGGVEVADQMSFARGVPQRFEAAALLLLEQLGRLRDGKVTLSDTSVA